MCSFQGAPKRSFYRAMFGIPEKRLSIRLESAWPGPVEACPLHPIEIVFYSAALPLAGAGLTWFLFR
jgi:hypothetical protein